MPAALGVSSVQLELFVTGAARHGRVSARSRDSWLGEEHTEDMGGGRFT